MVRETNIFNIYVEGKYHAEAVDALHSQTGWLTSTMKHQYLTRRGHPGMVSGIHAADDDALNWDVGNASITDSTDIYQQKFKGNYNQLFFD